MYIAFVQRHLVQPSNDIHAMTLCAMTHVLHTVSQIDAYFMAKTKPSTPKLACKSFAVSIFMGLNGNNTITSD